MSRLQYLVVSKRTISSFYRLPAAAPSVMVGSAGQVPDVEILVKMSPLAVHVSNREKIPSGIYFKALARL